jgi:hypothetical protein
MKPHLQYHAPPGKLREKLDTIRVEVGAPAPDESAVASNQVSKATRKSVSEPLQSPPPAYVYSSSVANRMAQEFETPHTPSIASSTAQMATHTF